MTGKTVIVGYEDGEPVPLEITTQEQWDLWLVANGVSPEEEEEE